MAYNERIADRIREALLHQTEVEEKKMFRGICFMVNRKMCICVSENEIMCRIDPKLYEILAEKEGCRPMVHRGKTISGFLFVSESVIISRKNLDYWIGLCLDFNKIAKASKTSKRKKIYKKK